jgi:hypothetical protein
MIRAISVGAVLLAALPARAADPVYADRWVFLMHNLQVDAEADEVLRLIDRSRKAGYTGIVLADHKLNRLGDVAPEWFRNADRVKKAAAAAKLELIPAVFPIGYSSGLLYHDPNLAEGVPVRDAPFVAKGARVVPAADGRGIENGDFETADGNKFSGFGLQDGPGKSTFADRDVVAGGKQALRMKDAAGNCRVNQLLKVRPWACYRMSAKVKTKDFKGGDCKLLALAADGRSLTFHEVRLKPTQDWTELEVIFNSLGYDQVTGYLGVWGGFKGTVWADDWKLEEMSLVNVLRRDACPFQVTSADGGTVYEEGKDFQPVKDPKLGQGPGGRGEYDFRHAGAEIRLTPASRIKDGTPLKVSWYHPVVVHAGQVPCSLTDPKVFALLKDQAKRVQAAFKPKTWLMSHDEVRVAGWDRLGEKRTPGELLAENVRQCVGILRGVAPSARIAVWSDMFDPHHNAVDNYYLVNGPLKGSWEGLSKDVIVVNWNGGKAADSLKWFADRGHKQVIAGYYDSDDQYDVKYWDRAAQGVKGVTGFMYTTWHRRFDKLEAFGQDLRRK